MRFNLNYWIIYVKGVYVSIKEEIHLALAEVQKKVSTKVDLDQKELELLFLTSLIEEEA